MLILGGIHFQIDQKLSHRLMIFGERPLAELAIFDRKTEKRAKKGKIRRQDHLLFSKSSKSFDILSQNI